MTFSLESHRERLKNIKGRKSSEEKEPKAGKYKECASALKTEEKEENARLIFDRQAGRLSHRRFWQTFSPAVIRMCFLNISASDVGFIIGNSCAA